MNLSIESKIINLSFLFVLLPLIYLPNIFNPYEFPKFIFFVAVVSILFLLNIKTILKKMAVSKIDALTKLIFVYGLVVYLADLLGIDPRASFLGSIFRHQGFISLLAGICLFLVVRYGHYKNYTRWILIGGFLVSLFAIWQGIAFNLFHDFSIPTYQGRIVGTLGNPNSLAGYLAMVLPFALFNKNKIVRIILSLVILTAVIFTDSRSGFLAVGIIFSIYIVRLILQLQLSKFIKIGIFIVIVSLVLFKFADLFNYRSTVVFENPALVAEERGCRESWPQEYPWKIIGDIYKNSPLIERSAVCDNRLLMWIVGLEVVSKRPILGYGQENFELTQLLLPAGKMYVVDNAHNIFLETAVSSGFIGLLIFLGIIFTALRKANFTIKMSLIAFFIIAQFNPLSIAEISLSWFLLAVRQPAD